MASNCVRVKEELTTIDEVEIDDFRADCIKTEVSGETMTIEVKQEKTIDAIETNEYRVDSMEILDKAILVKKEVEFFDCNFCGEMFRDRSALDEHRKTHALFACKLCDYKSDRRVGLERHKIRIHTKGCRYSCKICGMEFKLRGYLNAHIKEVHSENLPAGTYLECNLCDKKFIKEINLRKHEKVHATFKGHNCQLCNYKSNRKSHLKLHFIRKHTTEYKLACRFCEKRFKLQMNLRKHERSVHERSPIEKNYTCHDCGGKFYRKPHLISHLKVHEDPRFKGKWYECDLCDYKNLLRYSLQKHQSIYHSTSLDFPCKFCGKRFKLKGYLTEHVRYAHDPVTSQKSFECEHCPAKFVRKKSMLRHSTLHFPETLSCNYCEFKCRMKDILRLHIQNNHEITMHPCDKCEKEFKLKCVLLSHIRRIHCDPTFQCDICKEKFRNKLQLIFHMRTHESIFFACHFCEHTFTKVPLLRRHLFIMHKDKKHLFCEFCTDKFEQNGDLKEHIEENHWDEPPIKIFECPSCDYIDTERSYFNKHIKKQHANKPTGIALKNSLGEKKNECRPIEDSKIILKSREQQQKIKIPLIKESKVILGNRQPKKKIDIPLIKDSKVILRNRVQPKDIHHSKKESKVILRNRKQRKENEHQLIGISKVALGSRVQQEESQTRPIENSKTTLRSQKRQKKIETPPVVYKTRSRSCKKTE